MKKIYRNISRRNWMIYFLYFISLVLIALPQNIQSCGGYVDPYDYYISFFSKNAGNFNNYRPFYYTSMLTFYDDSYEIPTRAKTVADDKLISEWIAYTKREISTTDMAFFIYSASTDDVKKIKDYITQKKALNLPDSIRNNGMTQYCIQSGDTAFLHYIHLAKSIEPLTADAGEWSAAPVRDNVQLDYFIQYAEESYKKAKTDFLKSKYGFVLCKLTFYHKRYEDCIRWYNNVFTETNASAVKSAALSYKAGSQFKLGEKKEAAYSYSLAFAISEQDKKSIFTGFLWATNYCNSALQADVLVLCRNDQERANVTGMFALWGIPYQLQQIKKIYALYPASPLLDILCVREISKIEDKYLTPRITNEKSSNVLYASMEPDSKQENTDLSATGAFFEQLAQEKATKNKGLYYAGAAYLAFIAKDYPKAKQLVAAAKNIQSDEKINDQLRMIDLLVQLNEKATINEQWEKALLPPLKWLRKKAEQNEEYKLFYRNVFLSILAPRYLQQKAMDYKASLCFAVGDLRDFKKNEDAYYNWYNAGISFVRTSMGAAQLVTLYNLMKSKNKTEYDVFLTTHAAFSPDDVAETIGTAYLRDYDFATAISWLKKIKVNPSLTSEGYDESSNKSTTINIDPFHDYINDWQRYDKTVKMPLTKLSLSEKLLQLQSSLDTTTGADKKAKIYYTLASAFYNMSYYGNAWMAVAYDRTGSDWNDGTYATPWQKEYYGVFKAREYYQKAYEIATNKEFKAAAFFLVAKCAQRQVPKPGYNFNDWKTYEKDTETFQKRFANNTLFVRFKREFGSTKFYQYAYNRCSYLRDFLR